MRSVRSFCIRYARLRVLGCGHQPDLRATFNHYFFLSGLFPRVRACEGLHLLLGVHDDRPRAVGWLSGACLAVRREVLDQVGPLSEQWFMYAEDMEWCARMTAAGWELHHVPEAEVEHRLGASADQNAAVSLMPITAGRSYFIHLHRPSALRLLAFDLIRAAGLGMRAAAYFGRGLLASGSAQRGLWRAKARAFRQYARAALGGNDSATVPP